MNEEEKEAIEELEDLHRGDYFCDVILNLIYKQQKEIEFYRIQELGYIQGYEDGKSHKQTAVAIKIENAEQEFIQRKIECYKENYISKAKIRKLIKEKAQTDTYNFKTIAVKDIEELLGE